MVTILLEQIIEILKGWLSSFTSWAEDTAEKLGLIEEATEYIDDIYDETTQIQSAASSIAVSNAMIQGYSLIISNKASNIDSNVTAIKNNVGSIATSAGTAAAFAEDCATNGLNILDKVTTMASDTTQMRADNVVVKSDLDKIYDAIRWSLINVLMTETESGSSPLVFDTDKAELINDLVCNIAATETGSGTKSPTNPYTISSISDLTVDVNSSTFTFALGQTVYGGSFDVTTGKLKITHGYATFDGSENWSVYATFPNHYQVGISNVRPNSGLDKNSVSSHFTSRSGINASSASITEGVFSADGNRIRFKYTDCADLTAWVNWVTTQYSNGTPLQVVYMLATPIESTLTAQAITALIGLNTISSNGNEDISVTYTESVKHYLDKQEA